MITKDMLQSIEFMKNKHLQSKSIHKGLSTTKVVFLLYMAPPNVGLQEKRKLYILKTRVFLHADRSSRVHSSALRSIAAHVRSIAQPGKLLYSFVLNFHPLTAFLCQ